MTFAASHCGNAKRDDTEQREQERAEPYNKLQLRERASPVCEGASLWK
jgi:hypothetical protein